MFRFQSVDISCYLPSSLSKGKSVKFGKILTHYFIQLKMFPTGASKAVLENIIFDEVRKETLLELFHNFIPPYEENITQQCLQRKNFDDGIV